MDLRNFSVYCNHVVTPAAIQSILDSPEVREWGQVRVDGFIGPSHVSAVIGSRPYEYFAEEYQRPVVIAGFEPLDVMQAIRMLVQQLNARRSCVENQFTRGVTRDGNAKAQRLVAEVFELRPSFEWRGLGELPYSGLRIKSAYGEFDAERRFAIEVQAAPENAACQCPAIIRGVKKPTDCAIFGTACTPRNPIGSCMVSAEGACAAYYKYRRGAVQAVELMRILLLVHAFNSLCAAPVRRAHPRRPRAVGRARHPRSRDQRGRRAVEARSHSRAVLEARDSGLALAAASLSHRASRAAGRSRPGGARLGDFARRKPLGRDGAAGGGGVRLGPGLGQRSVSDAQRTQEQPVSQRGDRRRGHRRARGARAHCRRAGVRCSMRSERTEHGWQPPLRASRSARSIGRATTPRRCCARSIPPTAFRAWKTACSVIASGCSMHIRKCT